MSRSARVCLDLTPNETMDRHGGYGRYGLNLLEHMARLPAGELEGIELFVLHGSSRPPVPMAEALDRRLLQRPIISDARHWMQRKLRTGPLLRSRGMDLFHSSRLTALPVGQGCPMVATAHDIIPLVYPEPGRGIRWQGARALSRLGHELRYRRPEHLIAISEATRRDLMRVFGFSGARITTIHHAVNGDLFQAESPAQELPALRRKYGLPDRWFLSVGSDHYRKNQLLLLEAWLRVASRVDEGLVLVGKELYGSTFQQILAMAGAAGVADRVRWLGEVEDGELPAFYRGATALVTTSLYEGFGMTLLEAMACGTAVLSARGSAHQEICGEDTIYFDPVCADELGLALVQIARDRPLRESLVRRGLGRAARFNWQQTARETLRLYRRLVDL